MILKLVASFALSCAFYPFALALQRRWSLSRSAHRYGCIDPPLLPQADGLLGLDVVLRRFRNFDDGSRNKTAQRHHLELGPTYRSISLGHVDIFTMSPGLIRAVLTDLAAWGVEPRRLAAWRPLVGDGIMVTDGDFWRRSRQLVTPLFRTDKATNLGALNVHVQRLLKLVPTGGKTVDMQPLFGRLILDFTTEFLFGTSTASLTERPDKDALAFLSAFQSAQASIGRKSELPQITTRILNPDFRKACSTCRDTVEGYIDQAHERARHGLANAGATSSTYVLVDELVRLTTDRKSIRGQLLNAFFAAHDTTATLLTNTLFNLARNPDVYGKLRVEILALEASLLDPVGLTKATYLRNVVRETMRFTPVVGQTARVALQDTVSPTGGGSDGTAPIMCAKGTTVEVNYFALHRRKDIFGEDADHFRPERWDDAQLGQYDFLPFGGGPRVCPGQQMATMQVYFVVACIAQKFVSIVNRDPVYEFVERYKVSSYSKNGCQIALLSD